MNQKPKILAFAGSLRKESTNKKTVKIAAEGAIKAGGEIKYIDLKDFPLPIYDGDIEEESGLPENAVKLQELLLAHDGFLIASPEYNSSISAALKNVIDWTSRPAGDLKMGVCYRGKITSLMSASPGGLGGLRGLFDIRKILSTMGVIVLPDQTAVSNSFQAFDSEGNFVDEKMQIRVEKLGVNLVQMLIKLSK